MRVRQALQAALTEWRNRRGSGALVEAADQAIAGVIEHLEQKLDALNLTIEQTIAGDPELRAQHRLLMSVPGIATRTAATLLVELPAPGVLNSARETAAYAGLNPCQNQSGSSLHRPARISRIGNAAMRTALYLPAITAMRHNPLVRALRERLEAKGELQPMQIVAAAMRKLLHLCFGVLKTRQPFDPAWPTTPTAA